MNHWGRLVLAGSALAVAVTLMPGCGGASVESMCERLCACTECSDAERTECVEVGKAFEEAAQEAGCDAEWEAYLDCREGLECSDVSEDACKGALNELDGCGDGHGHGVYEASGPSCESAKASTDAVLAKAEECGVAVPEEEGESECVGTEDASFTICFNECALAAPCSAWDRTDPNAVSALNECIDRCS